MNLSQLVCLSKIISQINLLEPAPVVEPMMLDLSGTPPPTEIENLVDDIVPPSQRSPPFLTPPKSPKSPLSRKASITIQVCETIVPLIQPLIIF